MDGNFLDFDDPTDRKGLAGWTLIVLGVGFAVGLIVGLMF